MISTRMAMLSLNGALKYGKASFKPTNLLFRQFTQQSKDTSVARRGLRGQPKIGETVTETGAKTYPLTIGRGLFAGGALLGLGSLAFYGLGGSKEMNIVKQQVVWPDYVRQRVRNTYEYFAASLGITAGAAYVMTKSPALMTVLTKNSMLTLFGSIALMIGSGMLVRSIEYENVVPKHLAWAGHLGIIGAVVAPFALMNPAVLASAAWYTMGIVGGLSIIAATAPSEKFLNMTAPLAIGFGVVFAASVGTMFLPPTTTMGLSMASIAVYGGLLLFSGFLLYDTQRIVHKAENSQQFDPINESISIYMDTLNIFIRMVGIMGGSRRK